MRSTMFKPKRGRRLRVALLAVVVGLASVGALAGAAISATQSAGHVRVYVFDCGALGEDTAVTAYLVVHPEGSLLWEAGTIPDRLIESGVPEGEMPELVRAFGATAERTLESQLAQVGYTPDRITYFAASHYHFDHIANANDYRGATWLVQEAERDAMFADGPPPFGAEPAFYSGLEQATTILLNGDHDLFGDGTVVLKSTPGHTPGHQALFLNLAETGPVVLGGDVYHGPAERENMLDTIPPFDSSKEQSMVTRPALEAFLLETGAELWIAHDMALLRSQRTSPEYYE